MGLTALNGKRARLIPRSIIRPTPSLTSFPRLASGFSAAVGVLVLVGWALNLGALRSVLPGLVAMNPATALTFVAAGLSLWLFGAGTADHRRWRMGLILAAAVGLVGLIKLFGVVTGWDLGVDQVLFHDELTRTGQTLPNRMAPNTALAFLFTGLALVAVYLEPQIDQRVSQLFALLATVMASLAFIGYVYGVPSLTGVSSYIHMAVNTAITFVVLSIGVLFARAHTGIVAVITSEGPGGAMARSQLPIAVVVPIILGWFRLKGQELRLYNTNAGLTIAVVYSMYLSVFLIWLGARALDRVDAARKQAEEERVQLLAAEMLAAHLKAEQAKAEREA